MLPSVLADSTTGPGNRLNRAQYDETSPDPPPPPPPLFLAQANPSKRSKGPSARSLGVEGPDVPLFEALYALRDKLAGGKQAYLVYTNEVRITGPYPLYNCTVFAI